MLRAKLATLHVPLSRRTEETEHDESHNDGSARASLSFALAGAPRVQSLPRSSSAALDAHMTPVAFVDGHHSAGVLELKDLNLEESELPGYSRRN